MRFALSIRTLSLELSYPALYWSTIGSVRCYAASQVGSKRPTMTLVREQTKRRDDGPSPLSPFSRMIENKLKQRKAVSVTSEKQKETKKDRGPQKTGKKKKEKSSKYGANAKAKPSKGVKGVASSRQLLVKSPVRPSKIPIWARPASLTLERRAQPKAPGGVSWSQHRANIKTLYPEQWNPSKKVSREAMDAIRELHKADPEKYPSWVLAQRFNISPEAARRILKSKWRISEEEKAAKVVKERKTRAERIQRAKEDEMHQMVRAGIKLKVHPDDQFDLR